MQNWSLRLRLNVMIAATMLVVVVVGSGFAVQSARQSVAAETKATVNLALQLIEAGLSDREEAWGSAADWLKKVSQLERTRHLRIVIYEAPQTILNLASRRPLPSVDAPAWFLWAVAPEPFVVEKRFFEGSGRALTIVVQADAMDETAEAWQETQSFICWIALLAVVVYLVVHITVGRAFRSVQTILEGLEGILRGDYSMRLPGFSLPEFARIAASFNQMAAALEQARDENCALTQRSLTIQEEERRHVAQELHDEFGQSLTAIKALAASLRHDSNSAGPAIDQIMTVCDRVFGVLRALLRRLRPAMLDDLGLVASLDDLIAYWRECHPALVLHFHCDAAMDDVSHRVAIHVFRIVQECLSNVVRHAAATTVWISLSGPEAESGADAWIALRVRDDGAGFDPKSPRVGFGLLGIRERVASLGGRFEIATSLGGGTSVDVSLPWEIEQDR